MPNFSEEQFHRCCKGQDCQHLNAFQSFPPCVDGCEKRPTKNIDKVFAFESPISPILIDPQADTDGEDIGDLAAHAMATRSTLSRHPIASIGKAHSRVHGLARPYARPNSPLAPEMANHPWACTMDGKLTIRLEYRIKNRSSSGSKIANPSHGQQTSATHFDHHGWQPSFCS